MEIEKTTMQKCATGTARTVASGKISNGKDRLLIYLPVSAVEYLELKKMNNVGFVLYNMKDIDVNSKPGVGSNFPVPKRHTHKEKIKEEPIKMTEAEQNERLAIEAYINADTDFAKGNAITDIKMQFKDNADKMIEEAERRIKLAQ